MDSKYVPLLDKGDAEYIEMTDPRSQQHTPIILDGGSGSRWSHQNLDSFFKRIYAYYKGKGLANIVMSRILNFVNVLFVGFVVTFFVYLVDYDALRAHIQQRDDICPGGKGQVRDASLFDLDCVGNHPFDLTRITRLPTGSYVLVATLLTAWLGFFLGFLLSLPKYFEMKRFYTEELRISNRDLQTIPWSRVMASLLEAVARLQMCKTRPNLSRNDVTNFILRRVDFMIGLFHVEAIDVTIRRPCSGKESKGYPFLPQQLEWCIEHVLKHCFFGKNGEVTMASAGSLTTYFRLVGFVNLVLAPFIFIYRVAHFCFHNSDLKSKPGTLTMRQWTQYAKWKIRAFCEVDHEFQARLNASYEPSVKYVGMFSSEIAAIFSTFVAFIVGGILVFLFVLGFIFDEEFAFLDFTPDRSVTWWCATLGAVAAICRGFIPDPNLVFDPRGQLRKVARKTQYIPMRWKGQEASLDTYDEFSRLFQLKAIILVEELASVFMTPLMLIFCLPASSERIVAFFRQNTRRIPGVGDVCSYAVLEAPMEASVFATASINKEDDENKIKGTVMNFQTNHPEWSPTPQAASIIDTGKRIIKRKLPDVTGANLAESLFLIDDEEEEEEVPIGGSTLEGSRFNMGGSMGGGVSAPTVRFGGVSYADPPRAATSTGSAQQTSTSTSTSTSSQSAALAKGISTSDMDPQNNPLFAKPPF